MVLVTKKAPNFTAPAILKNGDIIDEFNLKDFAKSKTTVLFFWPMDFTFVCPSEIMEFDKLYIDFKKRNVKIVGVSIDSIFVHQAWRNTLPKNGGIGQIQFPIVSDIKREIQNSYNVTHPNLGIALRATFVIDTNWIIRHQIINDLPIGRNIYETIRIIDALDFHNKNGEVCPANWQKGQEGMKASLDGVSNYLSKNYQ